MAQSGALGNLMGSFLSSPLSAKCQEHELETQQWPAYAYRCKQISQKQFDFIFEQSKLLNAQCFRLFSLQVDFGLFDPGVSVLQQQGTDSPASLVARQAEHTGKNLAGGELGFKQTAKRGTNYFSKERANLRQEGSKACGCVPVHAVCAFLAGGEHEYFLLCSKSEHSFMNMHMGLRCPGWGISTPLLPELSYYNGSPGRSRESCQGSAQCYNLCLAACQLMTLSLATLPDSYLTVLEFSQNHLSQGSLFTLDSELPG